MVVVWLYGAVGGVAAWSVMIVCDGRVTECLAMCDGSA